MRFVLPLLAVLLMGAGPAETIGGFDPATGEWYLTDGVGTTTSFYFGNPGDVPFVGDWDCDGVDTPGLYRRSDGFAYLRNSNTQGVADVEFFFGNPGDLPVAGDWDGDGCDTVSVYRPAESRFFVHDALGADGGGLGAAARDFVFGDPGDEPFAADLDGDGIDEVALHRDRTGLVYYRTALDAGPADASFVYGDPADRVLAADWTGDGTATVGAYRPGRGRWYLRHSNAAGLADETVAYGAAGWLPVAGRFGLDAADPGRGTLVISGTGDVNTSPGYGPDPGRGHAHAWTGVGDLFRDDDLTVVNLECVPSRLGSPWPKTFTFRCPLESLGPMRDAGVDVVSQANNHAVDYGHSALLDGLRNLAAAGLAAVGAGADAAEAYAPHVVTVDGWRVAVLAFTSVISAPSWIAGPSSPGQAGGKGLADITAAVRAAAAEADVVVVTVHWGIERDLLPRAADVARGRALVDAGADVVFGHHPHRVQPLEWYRGRPIFWSLGNFVWSNHSPDGNRVGIADVVITPDGRYFARQLRGLIVGSGHPVLLD